MKVSVSLPEQDVDFVDAAASRQGVSRSAVMHEAINALRQRVLGAEYEAAYADWAGSEDAQLWDTVAADGLGE